MCGALSAVEGGSVFGDEERHRIAAIIRENRGRARMDELIIQLSDYQQELRARDRDANEALFSAALNLLAAMSREAWGHGTEDGWTPPFSLDPRVPAPGVDGAARSPLGED